MASSVQQCVELMELAEKQQLTLMVGHTFIFSAAVRAVKEILDSGYLGEVFYISSQRLNLGLFQKDINVIWDLAPHDISIILYLLNQSPSFVNCQGKAHVHPGIEDVINMSLDFPNGGLAIIHNSWLDPNKVRKMTIVGSKRMIVYDDNETLEKIKIYDKRVEIPPHYDTFAEFHYSYHYGDMRAPYIKQVEPLKVQCQHFLDCIRMNTKPESSGLEGLQVVQILEAASESLKNGSGKVAISDARQRRRLSMGSFVSWH
jgi:predicted dehydrogenase